MALLRALLVSAILCVGAAAAASPAGGRVVVFEATGGGFAAAIAAARGGASSVTLLAAASSGGGTGSHIGGMTTGGLGHTDCGNASVIGGIALEFYTRVELSYPNRSASPNLGPITGPPCWLFEAHVAEDMMREMLAEENVTVVMGAGGVASVTTATTAAAAAASAASAGLPSSSASAVGGGSGGSGVGGGGSGGLVVTSLTTMSGETFYADVFIDASYEGDLLAAAGADTTFGREPASQYNESGGGRRPIVSYDQFGPHLDPYWPGTNETLPLIYPGFPGNVGDGDLKVEAYTYRLCMTRAPSHAVPVSAPPPSYNASTFELFRRLFAASPPRALQDVLACLGPIPNRYEDCPPGSNTNESFASRWCKCDMIGGGALNSDMAGASWSYPNASVARRRAIAAEHAEYVWGMVWFLGNDPAVPAAVRAGMKEYGLCDDEFADATPPYFPHQLYVREARRMVGDFVLTQNGPGGAHFAGRSVGLASYKYDAHVVQRVVHTDPGGAAWVVNEGEIVSQPPCYMPAYVIPYDTLLPKRGQLLNVLAAVPVSASHVVFTSLRMEPTWMIMGHAAGLAAAIAAGNVTSPSSPSYANVHDVDVPSLQSLLVKQGQLIVP